MKSGLRMEKNVLALGLSLSLCGLLALFSAESQHSLTSHFVRQSYWTILGILVFLMVRKFDTRHILELSRPLAFASIISLAAVLLVGHTHGGSTRWFDFGGFQWTPSEFARCALVLVVVRELSSSETGKPWIGVARAGTWWASFSFLILAQPDLGRMAILFPLFILLLWVGAVDGRLAAGLVTAGLAAVPLAYSFLKGYQKSRIISFLNPEDDLTGAGWNLVQSKIAIGSGGLTGAGWLQGTQTQYRFIPEKHTDFIFSVIGEEWGFLGCFLILALVFSIMALGIQYSREARDPGGALLAVGMTFLIVLEALVNMSMTVGLLPISGLPLPLVSYGGSSVVITYAALGVVSRVGAEGSKTRIVQGLDL